METLEFISSENQLTDNESYRVDMFMRRFNLRMRRGMTHILYPDGMSLTKKEFNIALSKALKAGYVLSKKEHSSKGEVTFGEGRVTYIMAIKK